jgi:hypothetical protein
LPANPVAVAGSRELLDFITRLEFPDKVGLLLGEADRPPFGYRTLRIFRRAAVEMP